MKKLMLMAVGAAAAILPVMAGATGNGVAVDPVTKEVDSFKLYGNAHNWHAVDRNSLIVWASPSKAYLIRLTRSSPALKSALGIGLTSTLGNVSAAFDDVIVEGRRYPIKSIYQLDRDEAKAMTGKKYNTS